MLSFGGAEPDNLLPDNDIVPVVSFVLNQLVQRNDKLPFDKSDLTIFHALKPPTIAVRAYLERIVKYSPCSPECYIIALVYIDRVIQRNSKFVITSLNVHRLLLTSIMVAVKYFDDSTYNNAYYAKIGGIPTLELNSLELDFLFRINFALNVSTEVFQRYRSELIKHNMRNNASGAAGDASPAPGLSSGPTSPSSGNGSATFGADPQQQPPQQQSQPQQRGWAGLSAAQVQQACVELLEAEVRARSQPEHSRLIRRAHEVISERQRTGQPLSPSVVRQVCEQLLLENAPVLSPTFVRRADALTQRLKASQALAQCEAMC